MQSSYFDTSSHSEAQANAWRGPLTSVSCSTSSSSLTAKPTASSVRNIRRKPVPKIPIELLQQLSADSENFDTPTSTTPPVLREKSLNTPQDTDVTPTKESAPSLPAPIKSSRPPQQQYLLDIDAPIASEEARIAADVSVQQLLRSATLSSSSTSTRSRKGPLRWMQEKEEHCATASTSAPPARQPTLNRKTSISSHLKLSLRRNKSDDPPSGLTISGPTNFVHLSTGTEGAQASSNVTSLRRASTTSRASVRSSMSSTRSGASSSIGGYATPLSLEQEACEDKPLYSASERSHFLRPLKSTRRPSKLSLKQDEPLLDIPAGSTSPKDKRRAIYAAPGSVPAILEPLDMSRHSSSQASKLSPIASPVTTKAGERFAAALDRTLGRAHGRGSDGGDLSPEPELSRSPSSGYESSSCTSNRSSLGSLQEFRTFLDFPDMPPGSRRGSEKSARQEDLWADPALSVPLTLNKI